MIIFQCKNHILVIIGKSHDYQIYNRTTIIFQITIIFS